MTWPNVALSGLLVHPVEGDPARLSGPHVEEARESGTLVPGVNGDKRGMEGGSRAGGPGGVYQCDAVSLLGGLSHAPLHSYYQKRRTQVPVWPVYGGPS